MKFLNKLYIFVLLSIVFQNNIILCKLIFEQDGYHKLVNNYEMVVNELKKSKNEYINNVLLKSANSILDKLKGSIASDVEQFKNSTPLRSFLSSHDLYPAANIQLKSKETKSPSEIFQDVIAKEKTRLDHLTEVKDKPKSVLAPTKAEVYFLSKNQSLLPIKKLIEDSKVPADQVLAAFDFDQTIAFAPTVAHTHLRSGQVLTIDQKNELKKLYLNKDKSKFNAKYQEYLTEWENRKEISGSKQLFNYLNENNINWIVNTAAGGIQGPKEMIPALHEFGIAIPKKLTDIVKEFSIAKEIQAQAEGEILVSSKEEGEKVRAEGKKSYLRNNFCFDRLKSNQTNIGNEPTFILCNNVFTSSNNPYTKQLALEFAIEFFGLRYPKLIVFVDDNAKNVERMYDHFTTGFGKDKGTHFIGIVYEPLFPEPGYEEAMEVLRAAGIKPL